MTKAEEKFTILLINHHLEEVYKELSQRSYIVGCSDCVVDMDSVRAIVDEVKRSARSVSIS